MSTFIPTDRRDGSWKICVKWAAISLPGYGVTRPTSRQNEFSLLVEVRQLFFFYLNWSIPLKCPLKCAKPRYFCPSCLVRQEITSSHSFVSNHDISQVTPLRFRLYETHRNMQLLEENPGYVQGIRAYKFLNTHKILLFKCRIHFHTNHQSYFTFIWQDAWLGLVREPDMNICVYG